jgi:hypothetical protein
LTADVFGKWTAISAGVHVERGSGFAVVRAMRIFIRARVLKNMVLKVVVVVGRCGRGKQQIVRCGVGGVIRVSVSMRSDVIIADSVDLNSKVSPTKADIQIFRYSIFRQRNSMDIKRTNADSIMLHAIYLPPKWNERGLQSAPSSEGISAFPIL